MNYSPAAWVLEKGNFSLHLFLHHVRHENWGLTFTEKLMKNFFWGCFQYSGITLLVGELGSGCVQSPLWVFHKTFGSWLSKKSLHYGYLKVGTFICDLWAVLGLDPNFLCVPTVITLLTGHAPLLNNRYVEWHWLNFGKFLPRCQVVWQG